MYEKNGTDAQVWHFDDNGRLVRSVISFVLACLVPTVHGILTRAEANHATVHTQ
jgi:hypothetical protein